MKINFTLVTLAFVLLIQGCGPSTKIEKSWADPELTPQSFKPFQKTLIVALLKDQATRRITEDKLVSMSKGKAVQSYTYLTDADLKMSDEDLSKKILKDGFDGVIVMSLLDVDKSTNHVPGSSPGYYGTWYGYYRFASPYYYDPGYYQTTKTYYIETNIYSLEKGKLIWSGVTSTADPANVEKTIEDIVTVIRNKMKQQGYLK